MVQSLSHSEEAVISDTAKLVGGVLQRLYVAVRMHSDTLCKVSNQAMYTMVPELDRYSTAMEVCHLHHHVSSIES